MPYFKIEDLPESVQSHLPKKAQEIYRRTFNKVWDHFRDESTLPKGETRVSLAAKLAWTVVKQDYEKWGTRWVRKGGKHRKKDVQH